MRNTFEAYIHTYKLTNEMVFRATPMSEFLVFFATTVVWKLLFVQRCHANRNGGLHFVFSNTIFSHRSSSSGLDQYRKMNLAAKNLGNNLVDLVTAVSACGKPFIF